MRSIQHYNFIAINQPHKNITALIPLKKRIEPHSRHTQPRKVLALVCQIRVHSPANKKNRKIGSFRQRARFVMRSRRLRRNSEAVGLKNALSHICVTRNRARYLRLSVEYAFIPLQTKRTEKSVLSGRGDAIRTRNQWFWRPLLYR